MLRRYFFILVFLPLMGVMAWVSSRVGVSAIPGRGEFSALPASVSYPPQVRARQQALELMDQLVFEQHYFRSVEGRFTSDLSRLRLAFPLKVAAGLDVRVEEATRDRLYLTAKLLQRESESGGQDLVSIDETFQLKTSFPLPPPRPGYLREHALRHLKTIYESPKGQIPTERGIYQGFFRYEVSAADHTGYSLGVRAPVLGVRFDLSPGWAHGTGEKSEEGEWAIESTDGPENETVLSSGWTEDLSPVLMLVKSATKSREALQGLEREPAATPTGGLEIEPIQGAEN